jgi:hypothetical protein
MCEQQFYDLLKGAAGLQEYARKRRITKLRYNARRLIYLAADANLLQLASAADGLPELYQEARIMEAVASGRIDRLLPLGTNAAQATAQPLAATGRRCHVGIEMQPNTVEDLALAVFLFNGVPVDWPERLSRPQSEIGRFAALGSDMELMRSNDPYVREIACLHGLRQGPRHAELLRAAFDRDEQLVLDAIDQFQRSAYY